MANITQLYHKQIQGDALTHIKLASQQVFGRGEYINKDNWRRIFQKAKMQSILTLIYFCQKQFKIKTSNKEGRIEFKE